jgi:Fe-S oxidoreductase
MKDAALKLVEENTSKIKRTNAKILVTSCPICYKVFNSDYKLDGMQVMHHSVFIEKLVADKKITLNPLSIKTVYHDPCELGRGSGIYEQPRNVLKQISEVTAIADERTNALCCGGSIGELNMSAAQRNVIRDQALEMLCEPNPDILVTACPLCKKTFNAGSDTPVMDIAELVAESLTYTKQEKPSHLVKA